MTEEEQDISNNEESSSKEMKSGNLGMIDRRSISGITNND
jgi:hypothetical protein